MDKNEKRIQRKQKKEKLTNQFMIQMSYSILGIVILYAMTSLYKNVSTLPYMYYINWIIFGVFTVLAVALIWVGAVKKSNRFKNYGCMFVGCSLVALWMSLYNHMRPVMQDILRNITGNEVLNLDSFWITRAPMIAIVIYLVSAFIVYCIKVSKK